MGLVRLSEMQGPGGWRVVEIALRSIVISVVVGSGALSLPHQMRKQREESLKEYQASAPPGAPPPVEMPPPADMVFLCIMLGGTALIAPLFSSLLTVVVFGPAAVVCGIVALAQGHLKGLVGMVLGIVGMIVWGMLFF